MLLNYIICSSSGQLELPPNSCVYDLNNAVLKNSHEQVFDDSSFYVICNGKRLVKDTVLESDKIYHFVPRLVGGKGGFGSMLRAIGAQIEKTTSREACRDLSGRRMRDINNEKKLKEWLAKEAEREQEREERKKDRLAKHLRPQHKFDDEDYHEQKAKVQEDLQEALNTGLKRKMKNGEKNGSTHGKKSKGDGKPSKAEWLGMELDSDDLSSGDSDMEADPGHLNPSMSSHVNSEDNDKLQSGERDGESNSNEENRLSGNADGSSPAPTKQEHSNEVPSNTDASHNLLASLPKPNVIEQDSGANNAATDVPSDAPVDLEMFSSVVDLQALGLDRLKNALMARGLKCGGTLEERAVRLMTVKGLSSEDVQTSHPALVAKSGGKGGKVKKSK